MSHEVAQPRYAGEQVANPTALRVEPAPTFTELKAGDRVAIHACCGPCAIDVVRDLRARGVDAHLIYANSNIAPADEYARRRDTIFEWARAEGVDIAEGDYDPAAWGTAIGESAWSPEGDAPRSERCRACFRQRFGAAAKWAAENGFDALGTTLSISPYQFADVMREELARACADAGIKCAFEDYSALYPESRIDARAAGMYLQNYCGCAFSAAEAAAERAAAKEARELARAKRAEAGALKQAARQQAREEKAAYAKKRARQKELLKQYKQKNK